MKIHLSQLLKASLIILLTLTGCVGSAAPTPTGQTTDEGEPATQQKVTQVSEASSGARQTSPAPSFSSDYILYVRGGYVRAIQPDGSGADTIPLDEGQPPLMAERRDPGQAWRSPDGARLAYLSGSRAALWVMGIDGSGNHMVADNLLTEEESTRERSQIRGPLMQQDMAWSPDSQRLAFFGAPEDHWDLFIADLRKGNVVRVTDDRLKEEALRWSPDSRYLAFKSYAEADAVGETLLVVREDGSGRMEIDTTAVALAAGLPESSRFNYVGSAQWLDSETFALFPETADASMGIWKGKIGTSTVEPILQAEIFGAIWSPEARHWAFVNRQNPGTILTLSPEGGEPQVIATDDARGPIWSPDGSKIMYSKGPLEGTVWDIYVADADGSNARVIVKDAPLSQDGQPGPKGKRWWTPDGDGIVYVVLGTGVENFWLAKLDGSPPKALTQFGEKEVFYVQPPLWSPHQRMLAFVGFSYTDTNLHLWTVDVNSSQVRMIEADVFWFDWVSAGEQ